MLIIALLLALALYILLGYLWVAAQPQLNATTPTLEKLRQVILDLPAGNQPLGILKWAIILLAFYLVADALISLSRRRRRK